MTDLNLLAAAAHHIARQTGGKLPLRLYPGDLFAMLPPRQLREEARRSVGRLPEMLQRHSLQLTRRRDRYVLDDLKGDMEQAGLATCFFWRLHQRLQKQDAPFPAFLSLNTHLWDLAWDAGGSTACRLLSHVLLCWTAEEICESMKMRQPVYRPSVMPAYLEWLIGRNPDEASILISEVVALASAISRAVNAGHPSLLPFTQAPSLTSRAPDRARASSKALNSHCLEARELADEFERRGIALPEPLDWDHGETATALQQLRTLPGPGHVAAQVSGIIRHAKLQTLRRQRGMAAVDASLHMAFTGNPVTGKTTMARLTARALIEQGLLAGGEVVGVARADLIGEYTGQTAPKVIQALQRAEGGVLLIDEAHGLITDERDPYGQEALDALVKGMEDRRSQLAVILCGYPQEMERLLDTNPGLRSRIGRTIHFPDYSAAQLLEILEALCAQHDYRLTPAARSQAADLFRQRVASGETTHGNARMVRNLFEEAVQRQATRLARTLTTRSDEQLSTLTAGDLDDAPKAQAMSA
ncbi:AAA family ATPase [Deinococcus wulumuqiensis]